MIQGIFSNTAIFCALSLLLTAIPSGVAVESATRATTASAPWSASPADKTEKETLADAKAALSAKEPQKAADMIAKFLTSAVAGYELEDLYGQVLLQLGRKDEAVQHFGAALRLLGDNEAPKKAIKGNLARADPFYTPRTALLFRVSKGLLETCQKMAATGHTERALAILDPLEAISTGVEKQAIVALVTKIRATTQEVKLDEGTGDEPASAGGGIVEKESKRYKLEANLEPEVAQRVCDVMDDIFNNYVKVYFDGDESRVIPQKVTIRIHPSHESMLRDWPGKPNPGIGGWWSPSDWRVTCYDTRPSSGSLDRMLMTLYHEASHQFMTMLAKGGNPPAWINEGTATFFEGAKAMADRRVLWPDAATERLENLQYQLTGGGGPTPAQVISFNEPGSYGGEYYAYGWGLVYYLQEYEDPLTLEKVFHPLYSEYRETIAKRGGDPMELFKKIFLAPKAPGGFTQFEPWAAKWREWILNQVYPLHFGLRKRDLRLEKAKLYIAAADRAKAEKTPPKVPEAELLSRALGQLEFIRKEIDGEEKPDADLIVMLADVLERMGRPQSTAALLEEVLELANKGESTLEQERYDELEKRLTKLDGKNEPLRVAKNRSRSFAKDALKLLERYQASGVPMTLTAYEFSRLLANVLKSDALTASAEALRVKARDTGLLHGAMYRIGGRASAWISLYERPDENFETGETTLAISNRLPVARLFSGVPLTSEYEVRCILNRSAEISRTTLQGVVFSGNPTTPWYVAGIDGKGQLLLYHCQKNGSAHNLRIVKLEPPVAQDESPTLAVRVFMDNRVIVKVGERAPIEIQLEVSLPKTAYIGVFARNGRTELNSTVLEVFP